MIRKGSVKEDYDESLIDSAETLVEKVENSMDKLKINDAVSKILAVVRKANKYIDLSMPWVLAKENNHERLDRVLYNLVETIRIVGISLMPFMVETPKKYLNKLVLMKIYKLGTAVKHLDY